MKICAFCGNLFLSNTYEFLSGMSELLRITFWAYATKISGYNAAYRITYKKPLPAALHHSVSIFFLRKGVSRMKRIDSSFQCCREDGSRSAAYVMQLRCANHLKVLCSKGRVLNVWAKGIVKTVSGECKEAERK